MGKDLSQIEISETRKRKRLEPEKIKEKGNWKRIRVRKNTRDRKWEKD